MGFSTDAIHGGQSPEEKSGAVITPIYATSTYKQDGIGKDRGYEYGRTANPTREALERNIAILEKGQHGVAYSSGMAATDTIIRLLKPGDEVIVTHNVYGGTYRLFEMIIREYGVKFHFVDTSDVKEIKAVMNPSVRLLFVESPTNPVLQITDIRAAADLAQESGSLLCVDNTFMTPYFQTPLELGADIVVHSTTKYLNGHSDMVGGIVVVNDDALVERLRFLQNAVGAVPSPFDCFLALRGTKTLAVRMRQHEENAGLLAAFLRDIPGIERVHYPGFEDHPQHALARKQQRGFGAIISIDVGSLERADHVLKAVRVFTLAESLGGVESLISHPASMTHGAVPKEDKDMLGVTDGLIRISVGIEDVEDLESDIAQALSF